MTNVLAKQNKLEVTPPTLGIENDWVLVVDAFR